MIFNYIKLDALVSLAVFHMAYFNSYLVQSFSCYFFH